MDGFDETDKVVVVAATNREKFLDFALVRSGRFDLKIAVNLPSFEEKVGILRLKLQGKQTELFSDEQLKEVASLDHEFSGADLDAIVNEAIYIAKDLQAELMDFDALKNAALKIRDGGFKVFNSVRKTSLAI